MRFILGPPEPRIWTATGVALQLCAEAVKLFNALERSPSKQMNMNRNMKAPVRIE